MWSEQMKILNKRKMNIEIGETLDRVFHQYYNEERGVPVPPWRTSQPDWWLEYLRSLGMDDRNP